MAEFPRNNSGSEELSSIPHNHKLSLTVQECSSTSFSEVYLSHGVMTKHKFWNGYPKVLLGKEGLRTACTFLTDPALNEDEAVPVPIPDDKIKINSRIRAKLGVSVGESVTILKDESIPDGKTVCVRPFKESPGDLESVNLLEAYLWPYFKDAFRPVHVGDVFHVTRNCKRIKFKITNIDPLPFCIVGPGTRIRYKSCQSEELKGVESVGETPSVSMKEEPEEPELEITFLKVVPAPAPVLRLIRVLPIIESSANIRRFKNSKTDKELEESDNRSGSSSSSKHIHNFNANVNSSEGNARGSGQFDDKADLLKRKHSENMAQATAKSRKSEPNMSAAASTTTTIIYSDDDDGGCRSQGIVGGGNSLVSSSFPRKSVSISLEDEDDWNSTASANSSSQASASGRSASVSTTTTNNDDDWGCGNESERGGGSQFGDSRRQSSFNSNNDPWNNSRGGGGRGITVKGRGGVECSSFSSVYDDRHGGSGNRGSFGRPSPSNGNWPRRVNGNNSSKPEEDDWGLGDSSFSSSYSNSASGSRRQESYGGAHSISGKRGDRGGGGDRGQGRWGYGGRGGSRSRGGNNRGGDGNRGRRGFRGYCGRGPDLFQNRTNNNSYVARSQTATPCNIADADEDWDTPLLAPTPAPVPSSMTRCSSEIDEWSVPTGSSQREDHDAGKPRVEPSPSSHAGQCEIQSEKDEIHKVKPKPKPTELSVSSSQPLPKLMEINVGYRHRSEKSTDCEDGIIHDPPAPTPAAVDMHQNRILEYPLNEDVLLAWHQLALSLFRKGQFADALSGFKMVLDKRTSLLGPQHVDTLRSHFFVGRCLFKQKKKILEAKNILEQVLTIQKLVLPADHSNVEETEFAVAKCFDSLGKHEDAEALYRILYAKTNKRLGPCHRSALITQYNLALSLDMQNNKLGDAIKWYTTFIELGVQYLGPGNELVLRGQERIKQLLKKFT